jgi:hypothetical protein
VAPTAKVVLPQKKVPVLKSISTETDQSVRNQTKAAKEILTTFFFSLKKTSSDTTRFAAITAYIRPVLSSEPNRREMESGKWKVESGNGDWKNREFHTILSIYVKN